MPAKPPNIIVERWLPYKQQKRQVIYEKALSPNDNLPSVTDQQSQNGLIIQYANPSVRIEKQMRSLGIMRRDPFEQAKSPNLSSPKPIGTNRFFSEFNPYYSSLLEPVFHTYSSASIDLPKESPE
jgi:hypothetical protein